LYSFSLKRNFLYQKLNKTTRKNPSKISPKKPILHKLFFSSNSAYKFSVASELKNGLPNYQQTVF